MTFNITQQVEEEYNGFEGDTLTLERFDGKVIEVHIPDRLWDDYFEEGVIGLNLVFQGHYY